ncbi:MAG TPA: prepilin-type N-terminal cleavage/methylation domain-containing protein [Candidatus Hydrogenedentes bacterium]|nr:prepilin-type N-terminal cleavage/methylation domain-containing protein [Candidatus Hydrogenedentota bacterium]HOJ68227.1 prepilin-type N-terminal cleavage/methylation domain-containing protein [Candidatus Hydrogenedentota bacterium]HOK89709.1 prepilin-type N-terminal cleavage/methylation domain-containing protein [Candidatus Hydrogenedentota bacterium]HOV61822.1 prepilin-type N-terminal cleavage/methylation domain-containing protein [Candidatus Hydrogenedentota bacterium]HPO30032.1 prepilin
MRDRPLRNGFTLLELMMAMAVLGVVAVISGAVYVSTYRSTLINAAANDLQREVRDALTALNAEVQFAVKSARPGLTLPAGAQAISISPDGRTVTYTVPTDLSGQNFSQPITIAFVTEDQPVPEGSWQEEFGNAVLDGGEDQNGDGILNRQLVITRDGETHPLGAANSLANVRFALSPDGSMLIVTVTGTRRIRGAGLDQVIRFDTTSNIYLMN